ncbi:MAG: hypothetical protein CBR30_01740 [Dictyoglomus sp. NZ13-RE01]|nr:MAG: hypothetical protein CBR30_01740 [Dictyoglomus sp. NZ13-RE01]
MLSNLLKIIEEEGIHIEWWDFKEPISAVYVEINNSKIIGLRKEIVRSNKKLKCTLAEELGHYFTGSTYSKRKPKNYREKIEISKEEYKAKKWQAFYLIPEEEFIKAIKKGIREVWELAEYFDVDEELIKFYLDIPKVKENLIGVCKFED